MVLLDCCARSQAPCAGKGGNPDLIRESQKRRYADPGAIDKVIALDNAWRDGVPPL